MMKENISVMRCISKYFYTGKLLVTEDKRSEAIIEETQMEGSFCL